MIFYVKLLAWLSILGFVLGLFNLTMDISRISSESIIANESLFDRYLNFVEAEGSSTHELAMLWIQTIAGLPMGIGLLFYKEWARMLGIFLQVLALLDLAWIAIFEGLAPYNPEDIVFYVLSGVINLFFLWVLRSREVVERFKLGLSEHTAVSH